MQHFHNNVVTMLLEFSHFMDIVTVTFTLLTLKLLFCNVNNCQYFHVTVIFQHIFHKPIK